MSEKVIRVGIIGCANIARRSLIPAFASHPRFRLTAIGSRAPEKCRDLASEFACRASGYEELVDASDVELIYCPLPTGLHYEWVKKSLEAGKHVLCEKSLACNPQEVEDLVKTARDRKLFLMESFQFRFHAQNLYVKELLANDAIGPIQQLLVRFGIPPFPEGAKNIRYSAELGGGALLDNGAYTIKCATYLLGPEIKVLAAMEGGATPQLGNVNITGSMMLQANPSKSLSPATAQPVCVQTSYGFDHYYQNGYEIWGRDGKISTTRAFTARDDFAAPVILETSEGRIVKTFKDDHFGRLLDYMARIIDGGNFDAEYEECLNQARILGEAAKKGGS